MKEQLSGLGIVIGVICIVLCIGFGVESIANTAKNNNTFNIRQMQSQKAVELKMAHWTIDEKGMSKIVFDDKNVENIILMDWGKMEKK